MVGKAGCVLESHEASGVGVRGGLTQRLSESESLAGLPRHFFFKSPPVKLGSDELRTTGLNLTIPLDSKLYFSKQSHLFHLI